MDEQLKKQTKTIVFAISVLLMATFCALTFFFYLTVMEIRNVKKMIVPEEAPVVETEEATAPMSMNVETGKTRWFSGGPHLKEYKLVSVDGGFNWAPVWVSDNGQTVEFLVPSEIANNSKLKAHFDQLAEMKQASGMKAVTGMRGMTK